MKKNPLKLNLFSRAIMLMVLVVATISNLKAQDVLWKIDNFYYRMLPGQSNSVAVAGTGETGEITVPSSIVWPETGESCTVLEVEDYAFNSNKEITIVNLPASITTIGKFSFAFSGITSIKLPDSVIEIKEGAFSTCEALNSVELPSSLKELSNAVFHNCSLLKTISLPSSIEIIDEWAFASTGLETIELSQGLKEIGDHSFAFSSLQSIEIPEGVTVIGESAFAACENLKSVKLPETLTSLGYWAFGNCKNLISVNLPSSLTVLTETVFYDCENLESIIIPNSITTIESYALANCYKLTSLFIPASVINIAPGAFIQDYALFGIEVDSNNQYYSSIDGNLYDKNLTELLCVPAGQTGDLNIPSSVNKICDYALNGCNKITKIIIPEAVTEIGDLAFGGCSSLEAIVCYSEIPPAAPSVDEAEYDYGFFWSLEYYENVTLYVADVEAYSTTEPWNYFANILPLEDYEGGNSSVDRIEYNGEEVMNIFTLDGKKVSNVYNETPLNNLQKGIYIINGKKVAIR